MRFARNAKIFRGQLDMAPFVSVFFLLLVFVLLGALIITPGTPMRLSNLSRLLDHGKPPPFIEVSKTGDIRFGGRSYQLGSLEVLRSDLLQLPRGSSLLWRFDPAAPRELLSRTREIIQQSGLSLRTGDPIQLPASAHPRGETGPVLVLAIDLAGQFYFQNQIIQEEPLKAKLIDATRKHPDLTLVLMADDEVAFGTLIHLGDLASDAGVKQLLFSTRDRLPGKGSPPKPVKP